MGQGKIPWYTHRPMHRKRVTSDCMTVISAWWWSNMPVQRRRKWHIPAWLAIRIDIEWAIELLYNSVETGSQWVGDQVSWREDVVRKATTQQKGPSGRLIELDIRWVREKMLEWEHVPERLGPRLSSPGERERHTAMSGGAGEVNILQSLFSLQLPLSHANLTIKWEIYFF